MKGSDAANSEERNNNSPPQDVRYNQKFDTNWDDVVRQNVIEQCIVPLSYKTHKGTSGGRVAIIGGNELYVGAPYFASMAALFTGADLVSIYTANEATIPLKCYSPDFMVQSIYSATDLQKYEQDNDKEKIRCIIDQMVFDVKEALKQRRIHSVVMGPGLGRHLDVLDGMAQIIRSVIEMNIYLVMDADALFILSLDSYRNLLQGYDKVVITPNKVEYDRLFPTHGSNDPNHTDTDQFQNVIIVQKGQEDIIRCNNETFYICNEVGGMKRCGGIGDVLAGTIGTLLAWQSMLAPTRTNTFPITSTIESDSSAINPNCNHPQKTLALASYLACCIVKRATNKAFHLKHRMMSSQDILQYIGPSFEELVYDDNDNHSPDV